MTATTIASQTPPRWLVLALAVAAVLILAAGWVGYVGSDDRTYIEAAEGWLRDGLFVPATHFAVRHTITLPVALSFALLGPGVWQAALPMAFYAAAIAALLYAGMRQGFGATAAFIAVALFVFLPLTSASASIPNCDLPELLFVAASFMAFLRARAAPTVGRLLLTGLFAGLAFISRETTSALILFYGLVFLIRPGMPRARYFVIGAGFLAVIGAEMLYYAAVAGDPLLRFEIALKAAALPKPVNLGGEAGSVGGNPLNSRLFGPFLAVLVNSEFALLFWFALAAAFGLWRARARLSPPTREALLLVTALGLVWLLWVGYGLGLRPMPRYYWVPALAAIVLVAVWLAHIVPPRRRWLVVAFYAALGLALVDLANDQPALTEQTIARLARDGPVFTDPASAAQSAPLARWSGAPSAHIVGAPPPAGAVFVLDRKSLLRWAAERRLDPRALGYLPGPDWSLIRTERGAPTLIGRVLIAAGLEGPVGRAGGGRLIWEAQPVPIYRVGGAEGSFSSPQDGPPPPGSPPRTL